MNETDTRRPDDIRTAATITLAATLVILLVVTLPTLVLARPHGGGEFRSGGHGMEMLLEQLDLSAQQDEEIHSILDAYRPEFEDRMGQMKAARTALQDQIHAELFDETAIRQAAANVSAVDADLAVLRARVVSDVNSILTPEQREETDALRQQARDFRERRFEHRRQSRQGSRD